MIFRHRTLAAAFASLVASSVSGAALAEDSYPLVYGQRPIVLTKDLTQIEAAFSFVKPGFEGSELAVRLDAAFEYGIAEDLTLGVLAVPLGIEPERAYGQPVAYGTYRLLDQAQFEVGARASVTFPGPDDGDLGVAAGLVGRVYFNNAAFLNVGALFGLSFSDPTVTRLDVPVELGVSLTRNLFLSVQTGLGVPELDLDAFTLPARLAVGYTEGEERPTYDVFVRAGTPSVVTHSDAFSPDLVLDVGGRYYFQ